MKSRHIKQRSKNTEVDRPTVRPSSIPWLSFALLVLYLLLAAHTLTNQPITDSDFWHHLAFGRTVVEDGRFPQGDELSATAAGRPWVSSGWLPDVLLYSTYKSQGADGVTDMVQWVVLLAAASMLIYRRTRGAGLASNCLLVLLALAAASPRFLPRPDVFSVALMVPLMLLLVWYEEKPLSGRLPRRTLWRAALLPLLFLIWANCHMLFVIGFAITTIFVGWAVLQWRRGHRCDGPVLIVAWLISALACLVTPYGLRVFWFIVENARLNETGSRINELKPLWSAIGQPGSAVVMASAAAWTAVCGWLLWRQRGISTGWWRWCAIALLIGLVLVQRRQIGIAVFGITPLVLAGLVGPVIPRILAGRFGMIWPTIVVVLIYVNYRGGNPISASPQKMSQINCEWFPCEAVPFLKGNPPPPKLFHDLYTGGFLAYHLAPQTKVFIDGRLEVYNNGTYDDFFAPPEGRMPLTDLFQKYEVQSALLDWRLAAQQPTHTAAVLAQLTDWQLCWFSDHYALFVHSGDATTSYTAAHAYRYLNPLYPAAYTAALSNPETAPAAQAEARRAFAQNPDSHLAKTAMAVAGLDTGL